MGLQLRVKLITGDRKRISLPELSDPNDVAKRLESGQVPFSREWLQADDGELVRTSSIVSIYVEPKGDSEPLER